MGASALGIGSLAVGALGAGVSAIGGIENAESQAGLAKYQAQVAQNNATIAGYNARQAAEAGQSQAETQGLKNRANLNRIVAGEAANGVDVTSGSPVDVQESERQTGQEDTDTTLHNAFMQAYGYNTQAVGFQSQAGLESATAENATALEPLTAGAGLLGSASSLGTNYVRLQQSGAFPGGGAGP